MGASCSSSKLSQVHCPSENDRPPKESKQRKSQKKLSCLKLGNLKKKQMVDQETQYEEQIIADEGTQHDEKIISADNDITAPNEAAFISINGGAEPPGTISGTSPRTDRQVSPITECPPPPPQKEPSPRIETKPKAPETLPVELPVVPAETSQKAPKDSNSPLSTSASITESPRKPLASEPEPVAAGKPQDATGVEKSVKNCPTPSIEKAQPEVALPVFHLQPVSVLESEVQDVVDKYSARIHADFQKTFDCSWASLQQEIDKCQTMGITLEWFWIVSGTVANAAEEADGLVVIKVQKGSSTKKGEVVHISITGDAWSVKLPVIIDTVCKDFFKNLPIKAVYMTLWYSVQADTQKFAVEASVASVFKEKGFKWYQLKNLPNGKRGQTMTLKRGPEDCEIPEELWGLSISLSMFMPMGGDHSHKEDDSAPVRPRGMGSRVMIAECLRRHVPESLKVNQENPAPVKGLGLANVPPPTAPAPAQGLGLANVPPAPVKGLGLANVPPPAASPAPVQGLGLANVPPVKGLGLANVPPPAAPVQGLGLANVPPPAKTPAPAGKVHVVKCPPPTPNPAPPPDSGLANIPPPAQGPTNQVEDTLTEISNKRQKGVSEIFSKDTTKTAEAEEFLQECHSNTSMPSKTMSEAKTWLCKKEGVERLICGGTTLTVDWLRCNQETNPKLDWMTYLRVPVRMLAKSPNVEHPLSYIGTSDEDIFVIVWPCEKDDAQSREDFLKACVDVVRNVEQMEDPLPFDEVLLPRFELQTFQSSLDIHKPAFRSLRCDEIHKPKELVSVELTPGQSYRGALKQAVPQVKKEPFAVPVTGTGSFVFCIWHAKLDDLEEPLFLTRVDPADWCTTELS